MEIAGKQVPEEMQVRLAKLVEMVKRGTPNEQIAAKGILDKLCTKYGLTIDELFDEKMEPCEFYIKASMRVFFYQLWASVFGQTQRLIAIRAYCAGPRQLRMVCMMTKAEYADFERLWDWHWQNFTKERRRLRKLFMNVYVMKYNLYPQEKDEAWEEFCRAHPTKRKGPSGADIMDIHNLSQSISKKSFHKQLNG